MSSVIQSPRSSMGLNIGTMEEQIRCNTDPGKLESPLKGVIHTFAYKKHKLKQRKKCNGFYLIGWHVLRKPKTGTQKFLFLVLFLALQKVQEVNLTSPVLIFFRVKKKKKVLSISGKQFKMSRLKTVL